MPRFLTHRIRSYWWVLFLVAGCAPAHTAGAPLYGVVRDTAGTPIPEARVGIVGTVLDVHTDSAGHYAFDSLLTGIYTVRAARLGYWSVQRDTVQILPGKTVRVDFELRPGKPVYEVEPSAVGRNSN